MNIVIIGAGAAGCFASIEIKRLNPSAQVTVIEKHSKPLAKVAITGGGRCNLTNSFANVKSLEQVYPRGFRLMKRLFHTFSYADTYAWFENEGVQLVTQDDECVFPQSQNAMEIVGTLLRLMERHKIRLFTGTEAKNIHFNEGRYEIETNGGILSADKILVTTGGHPTAKGFEMLSGFDLDIVQPVPSLFTLNINDESLKSLMGTVVENAQITLVGTKIKAQGALLITHWGISGPATLKLSAAAARILAESDYKASVSINWLNGQNDETAANMLRSMAAKNEKKQISSAYPTELNARLWKHLLDRAHILPEMRWKELQGKWLNMLVHHLTNDEYQVTGKSKFKEEFVTCGGVALSNLNQETLEAKKYKGLFFAGEVTDVDAITGGFNLQAAWTMGYAAAHGICND